MPVHAFFLLKWLMTQNRICQQDGHCAACTLRFNCDVRTLTLRLGWLGRQHSDQLARLPGGVDTLRGVCVAGCNDALQALEN
mmetsp:Transcript_17620/g.26604  ORF Transcript_17620/g.26604 Transcript_17620/m.26604 type:complete len:82 (+) Transcript_17620:69-314(+)